MHIERVINSTSKSRPMRKTPAKFLSSALLLLSLSALLASCCTPRQRQSLPQVILGSYSDTAIYDVLPTGKPTDSGFYPLYQLSITNVGSEADTFGLQYSRGGYGYEVDQYVTPGATAIFRTPGPISDTSSPRAQYLYYSFFVASKDSIPISKMRPSVSVRYGSVYNGPEGCNSEPLLLPVDIDALHH